MLYRVKIVLVDVLGFLGAVVGLCVSMPLLFFVGFFILVERVLLLRETKPITAKPGVDISSKGNGELDLHCIVTQQRLYPLNKRVVGEIALRERAYRRRIERLGAGWRRGRRIRESHRKLSSRQS